MSSVPRLFALLLALAAVGLVPAVRADVRLPAILGSNMVLQRDREVPLWGWAEPGEKVTVTFGTEKKEATADDKGRWQVKLAARPAGGPFELTVAGKNTMTLANVLVGEVWLCSGQSNMQWNVNGSNNAKEEVPAATFPKVRLFQVPHSPQPQPQDDCKGQWVECSPQTVGGFSAVGYFFGRELHRQLDVPVGLVNTSVGGTPAEAWTPRPALAAHPEWAEAAKAFDLVAVNPQQAQEKWRQARSEWQDQAAALDAGNAGAEKGWAGAEFDDSAWPVKEMPASLGKTPGVCWLRLSVEIVDDLAGKPLKLQLGPLDDLDTTYFNGQEVGATTAKAEAPATTNRVYEVPGKLVKAGNAVIAIRLVNLFDNGGMMAKKDTMKLVDPRQPALFVPLDGLWRYQDEQKFDPAKLPPPPPATPPNLQGTHNPGVLYNGMVQPLVPLAVRGAIWYQGESNAGRAKDYRKLLTTMITAWRGAFANPELAFYTVQLANFMAVKPEPSESSWAEVREAQERVSNTLPHCGQAVIIDIGDAGDIHPRNKQDVGKRLALAALGQTYGKQLVYAGPLYESMAVEGKTIRVKFNHVGAGLEAKGGEELKGFAIAGADGKFVWAQAAIDGETVVVQHADIAEPKAVRYAWADNPVCNLYNKDGLPASPFRSDRPAEPGATPEAKPDMKPEATPAVKPEAKPEAK